MGRDEHDVRGNRGDCFKQLRRVDPGQDWSPVGAQVPVPGEEFVDLRQDLKIGGVDQVVYLPRSSFLFVDGANLSGEHPVDAPVGE